MDDISKLVFAPQIDMTIPELAEVLPLLLANATGRGNNIIQKLYDDLTPEAQRHFKSVGGEDA